jgi:hypothetical protein
MGNNIIREDLTRGNFHWIDFFRSDTAAKLDIDNYPDPVDEQQILTNLMSTADLAQEIRELLNCPVLLNSAYRCLLLNNVLPGASKTSQHMEGLAIDIISPRFGTPEEIMLKLHSEGVVVDQCFCEGSWLHVSRKVEGENRMMYGYFMRNSETGKRIFKAI